MSTTRQKNAVSDKPKSSSAKELNFPAKLLLAVQLVTPFITLKLKIILKEKY